MKSNTLLIKVCIAIFIMATGILSATAKDSAPNPYEEATQVEGQNLVLNGNGPFSVNRVKLYSVGIYVPARKSTAEDLLALPGIVRVKMVMLKTVESETMSRRFIADIHANTSKEDRLKIAPQIVQMGMGFGSVADWNIGDVLTIDWLPGKGTVVRLNGKQMIDTLKDPLLMQTIMKIWIGESAYDAKLKKLLLGEKG